MWFSDAGAEYGLVRWIGRPGGEEEILAGVEFVSYFLVCFFLCAGVAKGSGLSPDKEMCLGGEIGRLPSA